MAQNGAITPGRLAASPGLHKIANFGSFASLHHQHYSGAPRESSWLRGLAALLRNRNHRGVEDAAARTRISGAEVSAGADVVAAWALNYITPAICLGAVIGHSESLVRAKAEIFPENNAYRICRNA